MADSSEGLILLVDDDPIGRSVRKLVLEAQGHSVLAVGDAAQALRVLESEPVRLAILDYFLQDTNGVELARLMRQVKPEVPILLLSGSGDVPEGTEHVDHYLSKLAPVAEIEKKIVELLGGRGAPVGQSGVHGRSPRRGPARNELSSDMKQQAGAK